MQDNASAARAALLEAVIRTSLEGIIVADGQGRVVEFNQAAEDIFGYSRAEVLGRSLAELIIPARHRHAHAAGMARLMAGGAPVMVGRRVQTEAVRKNGEEFAVELAIAEAEADGERLFAASLRDLTEQRRNDAARRESERRLAAFLAHAPIGMYLKDVEGRYVMVNTEMGAVFGRPPEEVVGLRATDLFSPEEAAMIAAYDEQVRQSRLPVTVEEHLPGLARYAWTMVVRFPIAAPDGGVELGGFDIDITALKEKEAELQRSRETLHQAEKLAALGSLLAGVSHELNNPLSALIGQSLMLEEDLIGRPEAERAGKIRNAAQRCARIVQTFLAMARRRPAARAPVQLNAVIQDALTLTDYALRTGGVTVEVDLSEELPLLLADANQLHQAFVNLLINAQQAMEGQAGPKILRVGTRREGAEVVAEVSDSGPGVAAELAARIFEPFFTTKPLGAGTGVGLAFSRGVVEAHGGRLELAQSEHGARFLLRLPLPSAEPEEELAPPGAPSGKACTVLVVDDEPDVAETLADLLRREGCTPSVAYSAEQARALVSTTAFSMVITDLRMPEEDGASLVAWLEAHHPALAARTVITTGDTLNAKADVFLRACGKPILEKPFTPPSLRAAMAALNP